MTLANDREMWCWVTRRNRAQRKPGPEDRVRAEHMLALAKEAMEQSTDVSEAEFGARRLYQTSLAWYLQGIGEAASRISDESRALVHLLPADPHA